MIPDHFKLSFVPVEGAKYDFDFEKIVGEINMLAGSDPRRFLQFARYWCQESLFFLLYFPLRIPVNHPWLVDRITEVQNLNDRTMDLWAREHFKALSVDTKIFTGGGWKCHGDLQPGDKVFGSDGSLISVVANTGPMTGSKCYKIQFDDGAIVAGADHLWPLQYKVRTRIKGSEKRNIRWITDLTRTDELPVTSSSSWAFKLPRTPVLHGFYTPLPLDPYVLGLWLGDGNSSCGRITTADPEILDYIKSSGFDISNHAAKYNYGVLGLGEVLRSMSLIDNKHIPWRYLIASPSQRLALLQGLMDTDGTCNNRGTAYFVNTNHNIATGVFTLAASLGMKPHFNMYESQNTGEYKPTFGVTFQAYKNMPPFRMGRKLERCKEGLPANNGRYIRSVEEVESVPVNCIQVDAADGIYLAGLELIPTHNSTIITYGLNIQEILKDPNTRIGIFSHTRSIAKAFLRRIKVTLEGNDFLKALFPDILYQNPSSQSPKWSEDEGVTVNRPSVFQEATVEAWGLVDGMPTSKHFPVLNYDDVVTRESVSTQDQINKVEDCFRLSSNLGADGGKERLIGTIYHFADLYCKLEAQGGWIVRKHPAEDTAGNPVYLSPEVLAKKRRDQGPYVYNCQMLLNPVAKKDQKFRSDWLQYYRVRPKGLSLVLLCDPANSKKEKQTGSDYTVYWLWGLDAKGNMFLVDVVRDRLSLPERWKALKKMVVRWPGIQQIGYEQYGMTADIQHFQEMMKQEACYFTIMEMGGNKLSKTDRISRLIPKFEQKKIWLPEQLEYETKDGEVVDMVAAFVKEEYLNFPFSKHDDMLDAASRIEDEMFLYSKPYDDADDYDEFGEFIPQDNIDDYVGMGRSAVTGY